MSEAGIVNALEAMTESDGRDDSDSIAGHVVLSGEADLFAVRETDGEQPTRRQFLTRVGPSSVIPAAPHGGASTMITVPLPGASVASIRRDRLHEVERDVLRSYTQGQLQLMDPSTSMALAVVRGVNTTLSALAVGVPPSRAPRDAQTLSTARLISLSAGSTLIADGGVSWVRAVGGQIIHAHDADAEAVTGEDDEVTAERTQPGTDEDVPLLGVAGRDWLSAGADCTVECLTTWDLFLEGEMWPVLEHHFSRMLGIAIRRADAADRERLSGMIQRKRLNRAVVDRAQRAFRGAVHGHAIDHRHAGAEEHQDTGWAVLNALLAEAGSSVTLHSPGGAFVPSGKRASVEAVAAASAVRTRELQLPDQWWKCDLGPIIAERDGELVPLLFRWGRYHTIDPETRQRRRLHALDAQEFSREAIVVYLPAAGDAGVGSLLRSGLQSAWPDVRVMVVAAVIFAGLGLVTPVVMGTVLGELANRGVPSGLPQAVMLLVTSAVMAALVGTIQNLAVMRVEGRLENHFQIAVWDRLLRLPTTFFGDKSTGALATTVLSIGRVREAMSGLTTQAVMAGITVVLQISLLVVVDVGVALLAIGTTVVLLGVFSVAGAAVVRRRREVFPVEQELATVTHQILAGLAKIRLAAAEDRAFARWAAYAGHAQVCMRRVRSAQSVLTVGTTLLPVTGQLVLFTALSGPLSGAVGPENFFIVLTVYVMMVASLVQLVNAAVAAVASVPMLQEVEPVLSAETEKRPDRVPPPELCGEIELSGVTFAYPEADAPVVSDLSLSVAPGEFVALVGRSGSAKSTVLRLLLGFETPQQGAVLYDGHELDHLDATAVRQQCGVVLQNGALFAGSIRENICGSGDYSVSEVWRAAEMAGVDDDIAAMPMGMATMVPFGGTTMSAGQRQRILIARALIARPRILFFDEATSALDNRTQDIVTASTRELAATRVVIAHRLSTVVDADRIVVLDRGRAVQSGDFAALMADRSGLFHELASRQMLQPEGRNGDDDRK